jgi:hypothetical protein
MARLSAQKREKRGRYESRRTKHYGIKEQGHCRIATVTGRLKYSGYAYLAGRNGEGDLGVSVVIGRER